MFGPTRGVLGAATKSLLVSIFVWMASAPIAAGADDGLVDVRTLPRLEGAVEDPAHTEVHSLSYGVPIAGAIIVEATRKLLADDGWTQYLRPLEESSASLLFKKGQQGLYVSLPRALGNAAQAEGIRDVVLAFYRRELAARGWKEETSGAVLTDNEATLDFSSADQTATLRLGHKYDLTTVSLVAQVKEAALAARAKAKKEADEKFLGGCHGNREQDDRRGRGEAGRAGRQSLGRAAEGTRRLAPCRCRCPRPPRTSSSTARMASSSSIHHRA